jgi:hypothetical protein
MSIRPGASYRTLTSDGPARHDQAAEGHQHRHGAAVAFSRHTIRFVLAEGGHTGTGTGVGHATDRERVAGRKAGLRNTLIRFV